MDMGLLDDPAAVLAALHEMADAGSRAHRAATQEHGLSGPVRDLIYGLNTAVTGLIDLIQP